MCMRLLIIWGVIFGVTPLVFAGEITPPQPITYHCPKLPSSFKVGSTIIEADSAFWRVNTVGGVAQGSTIIMNPSDTYQYTSNPVYESIFGKTLWCNGILTMNGKQYEITVNTQVPETKCNGKSDKVTFTCMP